jgi:hypothetical protein
MSSPLNGGLYLLASRALSGREIWPMERKVVKDQLSGASPADGLFKWLALAWAVAFVPLGLLSLAVEWAAEQVSVDAVANNAGALMGIAITGVVWALLRYAATAGAGRPRLIDDIVVLVGAAFSWTLLPG